MNKELVENAYYYAKEKHRKEKAMADVILVGVIIATIVIAVRSLGLYEPGEKTDLSKFDGIDITKYEDDD